MPLLDIAIAEPSLWSSPGLQPSLNGKAPSSVTFGCWKILTPTWTPFQKKNYLGYFKRSHGKCFIQAVIAPEARSPVSCEDGPHPSNLPTLSPGSGTQTLNIESSSEELIELDEKEQLRRMKISIANMGKLPWNKGKKHSAETRQRISERTWLAMQNPKVRSKLQRAGHAQSEETKTKIAIGVRMGWERRRHKKMVQETCYFQWQNLIAEAAREGFSGQKELQWDSYDILNKQLEQEWLESIERRKRAPKSKDSKRAPKSLEQRRKISSSVAALWADPAYRERVRAGVARYHGTALGVERKARRNPSSQPCPKREPKKKAVEELDNSFATVVKTKIEKLKSKKKSNAPSYKDPLALSKLEMIKSIRAERVASDMKRHESVERAKLLIAEAGKAAKALEAAAASSPIARASLIETKKLIAEAIQSIRSIENTVSLTSEPTLGPKTFPENKVAEAFPNGSSPRHQILVNGNGVSIHGLESSPINGANFDLYMQDSLNGRNKNLPSSFKCDELPPIGQSESGSELLLYQPEANGDSEGNGKPVSQQLLHQPEANGSKGNGKPVSEEPKPFTGTGESPPASITLTKKWVRGRLVEVPEGE